MALTVTPGASDADSYADLAYADNWHALQGHAAWAAATTEAREQAMRRGTLYIDGRYRARFRGTPTNGRDQALAWPRADVRDSHGNVVASDAIPLEVKQATAEAALRELAEPGSLSPDIIAAQAVRSVEAGPVSVTFAENTSATAASAPKLPIVDRLLAPLIGSGGAQLRLLRG